MDVRFKDFWIASFLAMTLCDMVSRHCELRGTKQEAIHKNLKNHIYNLYC